MASGGARVRSGPPPTSGSSRSDSRGLEFLDLPAKVRKKKPPVWPLPTAQTPREEEQWQMLWNLPQSTAWRTQRYSYMLYQIALYTRILVACEDYETPAALVTQMLRMQDQLGLSEAGMQRLQWRIVDSKGSTVKAPRVERTRTKSRSRARLEVINGGAQS